MSNVKKLMVTAAGGEALNVEEVFSTYLYDGNGSTNTITNGIDLSGEGGLVWLKNRDAGSTDHRLLDTERGIYENLFSNLTDAEDTSTSSLTAFNSDGFTLSGFNAEVNDTGNTYVSWTFRKAPKFFDVVTYTGNGTSGKTVSHNLGSVPGMIIVKSTSNASNWTVYHRGITDTPETKYIWLNDDASWNSGSSRWNNTAPTSTEFTVGNDTDVNGNGYTYVAYLFAHNDDDGGFGPTGDQDIIKCGSWTGAGATEVSVSLGFEPQWLLVKKISSSDDWYVIDNMRGQPFGANVTLLSPNTTSGEQESLIASPTPDGLITKNWSNGQDFIYIAIRRGPMAVPEDADDVFNVKTFIGSDTTAVTNAAAGFPVDFAFEKENYTSSNNNYVSSRLTAGKSMYFWGTAAESTENQIWDSMTGVSLSDQGNSYPRAYWMWRRAPNFFDVVAYDGTGTSPLTLNHNLGVVPEMMWVKRRNGGSSWIVYHKDLNVNGDGLPETDVLDITNTGAAFDFKGGWHDIAPTATQFTVGSYNNVINNGDTYIAYLFASLAGVSKVGSFSHTSGTATDVDCGFSSGARFVLWKEANAIGDWSVFDTTRGIVSGNDAELTLNTTSAQSSLDKIDPLSSGFTVSASVYNDSSDYIFYAIA